MTTEYPFRSLVFQDDVRKESLQTLEVIRNLDIECEKLGMILEDEMSSIFERNPRGMIREDKIKRVTKLRLAMESIASKKVELAVRLYDFLDLNWRLIDSETRTIENAVETRGGSTSPMDDSASSSRGHSVQKRKRGRPRLHAPTQDNDPLPDQSNSGVPENEPLYCFCNRIAFGDMIACDNEDCPIEWFHYPCVNLSKKPKNSWICPMCSNKRRK